MTREEVVQALDEADQAPSKRQRSKQRHAAVRARLVALTGSEKRADAVLFELACTHKADLHTHAGRKDRAGWLDVARAREEKAKAQAKKAA